MDLSDLEQQAGRIVAEAHAQAAQILSEAREQAQAEAAAIREQARTAGHQEGYAAGHAEGQQQGHDEAVAAAADGLAQLVARWENTLLQLQAGVPTHMADIRCDLLKLALAIAARVCRREALRSTEVVRANVEGALELVAAGRTVTVCVHPDELTVLEGYVPELVAKMRTLAGIELAGDAAITPGGCVLRYGSGVLDATLETQIARIAAELVPEGEGDTPPTAGGELA